MRPTVSSTDRAALHRIQLLEPFAPRVSDSAGVRRGPPVHSREDAESRHEAAAGRWNASPKRGKYGVGLCVVSQRPTELSETVLSQCSNFICLRTTNPQDQDYIRKLMPEGEQDLADVLTTPCAEALAVGEAIPLPTRVNLYPPDPAPASSDAPVAESWKTGPMISTSPRSSITGGDSSVDESRRACFHSEGVAPLAQRRCQAV